MIGGKKCKTLREAKKIQKDLNGHYDIRIYDLVKANHVRGKPDKPRVYRYFVGTHLEYLNM
jgi:hypothetical protein